MTTMDIPRENKVFVIERGRGGLWDAQKIDRTAKS